MPVPKRKTSKRRRDQRSANKHITASSFADCKNCGGVALPHQVCRNCGFYGGRKVLETKSDRLVKRGEARQSQQSTSAPISAVPVEQAEVKASSKKGDSKKASSSDQE